MKTWHELNIDVRGRTAGDVKTRCPMCGPQRHHPNDFCLSANLDKGVFHCFKCNWAGTLLDGERTAPAYGARLVNERPSVKEFVKPAAPPPLDPDNKTLVRDWATKRALDPDVVTGMGVTMGVAWMPQFQKDVRTIQFPYFKQGEVVNIKYRGPGVPGKTAKDEPSKSMKMEKDAELLLYNFDAIQGQQQIAIVEGEPDVLACMTAGIMAVASVPNGAPQPAKDGRRPSFSGIDAYLASAEDALASADEVIIATDTDGPGDLLADELARRIGKHKCCRARWGDDCKDANDVLKTHGPEALRLCFANARPWPIEGVITTDALVDAVLFYQTHGLGDGLSTGFSNLDPLYRPAPGGFTVATGVPSHGKSAFMDHLMMNMIELHGWRFAVCSPENWPPERHMGRLLSIQEGQPLRVLRDSPVKPMTPEQVRAGMTKLGEHVTMILPEELTVDAILERALHLVRRHGINGLIVDPFTELLASDIGGRTMHDWIGEKLSVFRGFGRSHDVHVWIVAHPTKLLRTVDAGGDPDMPVVGPYDIAGSSHWANKSDNIITIKRRPAKPLSPVEVHVTKIRFDEHGGPGTCFFDFDPITRRYSPVLPAAA